MRPTNKAKDDQLEAFLALNTANKQIILTVDYEDMVKLLGIC